MAGNPIIGFAGQILAEAAGEVITPGEDGEELLAKMASYAIWQPIASSAISAVRWDPSVMEVRFTNGYEYAYPAVPMAVFEDFLGSGSKGRYLNSVIKPSYG